MRILGGVLAVLLLLLAGLTAFDYLAPYTSARLGLSLEQRRSGLHEARATLPGFEMPYLEGGSGEPLLLIHGFGADQNNFTRVARYLTPHYRVVIPDLPGFGAASKPADASYAIADQVERLRLFAAAVGLSRAHLGGSSMGGHIATTWAAKYPDEVASLWLLDPGGTAAAFDSELRREYQKTGKILLVAQTPEEHAAVRAIAMHRQPFLPYSFKRVLGERAAANFALHSKIFRQLGREEPLETWVTRLDTPALIVWGAEDRVLNPRGADAMKAFIPEAQVILMPGIGHLPMIEAVRPSAEAYLAFRHNLARP
ncbi:MAG: alpha/beta fold hydrolase [Gammaproteobacteria bacterium]